MLQDQPKILNLLCDHLSYEDVLALRSTCKDLKQIVDGKQFTKLHLLIRKHFCHQRLFYTSDLVGYPHSLHSDDLVILITDRFRGQFASMQRMIICYKPMNRPYESDTTEFDLGALNCFSVLRHLEIHELSLKGKLNLPELQIAVFENEVKVPDPPFELNCPKLRALRISGCWPALTNLTDQLDYLYCSSHDEAFWLVSWIKSNSPKLQRLSALCLETIDGLQQILFDLNSGKLSLPSLNRIRLKKAESFKQLPQLATSLDAFKENDRTKHIKFALLGRRIDSADELRRISSVCKWDLKLLRAHELHSISKHPSLDFLLASVREVQSSGPIELSKKVIKKLRGIERLSFGGAYNCPSTLELFARYCESLRFVYLYDQAVTERLLSTMSKHLVNLNELQMSKCQWETLA